MHLDKRDEDDEDRRWTGGVLVEVRVHDGSFSAGDHRVRDSIQIPAIAALLRLLTRHLQAGSEGFNTSKEDTNELREFLLVEVVIAVAVCAFDQRVDLVLVQFHVAISIAQHLFQLLQLDLAIIIIVQLDECNCNRVDYSSIPTLLNTRRSEFTRSFDRSRPNMAR